MPLPDIPKDHWENKNRHVWTQEQIDKLWRDEVGLFEFNINGCDVLIKPFDRNEKATLFHHEKVELDKLYCGKVIKIGRLAFDLACFPKGATCTYGDYVLFSIAECERVDIGFQTFFMLNDLEIAGVVKDPFSVVNFKEDD